MKVPSLRYHKASRQGRVTLSGKTLYCGFWGGPGELPACEACQAKYKSLLAQWLESGRGKVVTVAEILTRFMEHARASYPVIGKHGGEATNFKYALRQLEGSNWPNMPGDSFSADHLDAVLEQMRLEGYARTYANRVARRILRVFEWARRKRLITAAALADLRLFRPVRMGAPGWHENPKTAAVPDPDLEAARAQVSPTVQDILDLCRLVPNSRIGEILALQSGGFDTKADPWEYDLGYGHKTGHRSISKRLFFGPQAQAIVKRYMGPNLEALLFTHRRQSIWTALNRASKRTGQKRWTVHQLRKNNATDTLTREARKVAQAIMDHRSAGSSRIYAPDDVLRRELARLTG